MTGLGGTYEQLQEINIALQENQHRSIYDTHDRNFIPSIRILHNCIWAELWQTAYIAGWAYANAEKCPSLILMFLIIHELYCIPKNGP